ncbi:hypothetical protein ACRAWD_11390 [Caulobacter segnis]
MVLPFGVPPLDARLPAAAGRRRERCTRVAGGADEALHGATAARFAAGILARAKGEGSLVPTPGRSLRPVPGPGWPAAGPGDLRRRQRRGRGAGGHGRRPRAGSGLAGVIGEVGKLSMTASRRRLQLAAEKSGQIAIAVRRWRRHRRCGRPWSAGRRPGPAGGRLPLPSSPPPPLVPGVGRPRLWFHSAPPLQRPATPSTSS